jgi:hypothetical protein
VDEGEDREEGIMTEAWQELFGTAFLRPTDLYANAPITESGICPTRPNEYPDNGRYTHQNRWYEPVEEPDTIDDIVNWQIGRRW